MHYQWSIFEITNASNFATLINVTKIKNKDNLLIKKKVKKPLSLSQGFNFATTQTLDISVHYSKFLTSAPFGNAWIF